MKTVHSRCRLTFLGRVVRGAGGLLAGLVLACLLFEGVLRLTELPPAWKVLPVAQANLYAPDPLVGYRLRPGAHGLWITENRAPVSINAEGLRNPPLNGPAGVGRQVYALGDSMVEALQVTDGETFVRLSEQALQRRAQADRVLNFGLSGATPPVQLWRFLSLTRQAVLSPRPGDVVIFSISYSDFLAPEMAGTGEFVGYDRNGDGQIGPNRPFLASRGYQMRSGPLGEAIYQVMDHSRLALVLNQRKNVGLLAELPKAASKPAGTATPDACQANPRQALATAAGHIRQAATPLSLPEQRLQAWLDDVRQQMVNHGLKVVVVVRGLSGGCLNPDEAAQEASLWRSASAALRDLFATRDIQMADLDQWLLSRGITRAQESALHGFGAALGYGHLNPDGHRVWADLYEELVVNTSPAACGSCGG
ncbi:SGNH/GDSL hydrolase family protein [Insolitispirillum peregrinum]|uniref:GDSL-like Lipase/Acylhydrolase family protein n=1 Tax=Insolitispirillum peregrinum TaxID=80876 RepID=A0A1N7LWX7_9PROT|nr:SGNH/GDSL hydrolase family protein [Insolitispirillum peregrinum]SIS78358.1 GDSL-like Lipase/Acylhydrolase family protein [Insolitispirillum peregrinum]